MHLTQSTDFALRTLIYVGTKGRELSTIAEVAASFQISRAHLMKVVNRLVRLGYIEGVRGRAGGLRLARSRSPSSILVGEVVRDFEESLAVVGCLAAAGFCKIDRFCVLKAALADATDAFLRSLDRRSLEDLLEPKGPLSRVLLSS